MTTYKEIKGTQIEAVSSDPSNPVEGQVWYNTTDNVLKGQASTTAGSWASGGALNTGRDQAAGSGTQTSTLVFGGGPPNKAQTEAYDGSSWTEVNDLNTARRGIAGAGADSTSALAFGGGSPGKNETETWNGTNWTEVNNLNTSRYFLGGVGIQTAALAFGGYTTTNVANTESWNGTNWTEVNDLSSGRAGPGSAGIYTSALAFGGNDGSVTGKTETWNGTNWTEVNDLNTVRVGPGGGGLTNTAAIAFGGSVPYPSAPPPTVPSAVVEDWDGTSWTEVADLSQARAYIAGSGSYTAALCSGGSDRTDTEEWTGAGAGQTRTFTDS
jgi:hypothetical protein